MEKIDTRRRMILSRFIALAIANLLIWILILFSGII